MRIRTGGEITKPPCCLIRPMPYLAMSKSGKNTMICCITVFMRVVKGVGDFQLLKGQGHQAMMVNMLPITIGNSLERLRTTSGIIVVFAMRSLCRNYISIAANAKALWAWRKGLPVDPAMSSMAAGRFRELQNMGFWSCSPAGLILDLMCN